jgi:hypothetical protein
MDADCVLFAPSMMTPPIDLVCQLLASGKNVVSPAGPFLPNKFIPEEAARVEAACREGNSSFHGCGIHPGYAGDILPITLTRLMNRVDCIEVSEIIDKVRNPMIDLLRVCDVDPDELGHRVLDEVLERRAADRAGGPLDDAIGLLGHGSKLLSSGRATGRRRRGSSRR